MESKYGYPYAYANALLVIAGFLMARFFQIRFPGFFEKWNHNGVPGITLFIIIMAIGCCRDQWMKH